MAKVFFSLGQPYDLAGPNGEALRVRRMENYGRLVLYRIMNDPPPYYFVMIKNFEPEGRDEALIDKGLAKSWAVPTWRFQCLTDAEAKFERLKPFFPEPIKRTPTPAQLAAQDTIKQLAAQRRRARAENPR